MADKKALSVDKFELIENILLFFFFSLSLSIGIILASVIEIDFFAAKWIVGFISFVSTFGLIRFFYRVFWEAYYGKEEYSEIREIISKRAEAWLEENARKEAEEKEAAKEAAKKKAEEKEDREYILKFLEEKNSPLLADIQFIDDIVANPWGKKKVGIIDMAHAITNIRCTHCDGPTEGGPRRGTYLCASCGFLFDSKGDTL